MGAVPFIETMDHIALSNITQEEFEENLESGLNSMPEDASGNPPAPNRSPQPRPHRTRHLTCGDPHIYLQYQRGVCRAPDGWYAGFYFTVLDPSVPTKQTRRYRRTRPVDYSLDTRGGHEATAPEDRGCGVETAERAWENILQGVGRCGGSIAVLTVRRGRKAIPRSRPEPIRPEV